ncbi:hypothetical protein G5I_06479 [Acromyrmex echinatior]|uniref:Uncharacterized protein n=1 Tax=Acromyrmex echinatior TaxID=103372 RepID=F4WL55_ACREC|nr:hypothetical protein G5I_06479 [Acromyrmex echinatior]
MVNPETPTILRPKPVKAYIRLADTRFVTNPRNNDSSERVQQSMTKKRKRILSTGKPLRLSLLIRICKANVHTTRIGGRVDGDGDDDGDGGGGGPTDKSSRHRSVTNEPAPSVNYPRLNSRRDSPLLRSEMKISERATNRPVVHAARGASLSLLRPQVKRKLVVRSRPLDGDAYLKKVPMVHAGAPILGMPLVSGSCRTNKSRDICDFCHTLLVKCKSQRTRFFEQRKILVEKCALARGKYQTYLEMFEHSPREVCARIRKSGEIQILRFDYP